MGNDPVQTRVGCHVGSEADIRLWALKGIGLNIGFWITISVMLYHRDSCLNNVRTWPGQQNVFIFFVVSLARTCTCAVLMMCTSIFVFFLAQHRSCFETASILIRQRGA